MRYAYSRPNSVAIGGFFDDLGDFVTDPTNWIRLVTFQGWTSILTSALPGLLGVAANQVIIAMPGLIRGEPFSDALVAEYTWRLSNIVKYGGEEKGKAANDGFKAVTSDPELRRQFEEVKNLKAQGLSTEDALKQLKLTPEDLYVRCIRQSQSPDPNVTANRCREDILALGVNYHAHEALFDSRDYDIVTGKKLPRSIRSLNKARRLEQLAIRQNAPGGSGQGPVATSRDLEILLTVPPGYVEPVIPPGALAIEPKPRGSIPTRLLTLAILTSPAWLVFLAPQIKRTFRRLL